MRVQSVLSGPSSVGSALPLIACASGNIQKSLEIAANCGEMSQRAFQLLLRKYSKAESTAQLKEVIDRACAKFPSDPHFQVSQLVFQAITGEKFATAKDIRELMSRAKTSGGNIDLIAVTAMRLWQNDQTKNCLKYLQRMIHETPWSNVLRSLFVHLNVRFSSTVTGSSRLAVVQQRSVPSSLGDFLLLGTSHETESLRSFGLSASSTLPAALDLLL